jgi:hypothetical protein
VFARTLFEHHQFALVFERAPKTPAQVELFFAAGL